MGGEKFEKLKNEIKMRRIVRESVGVYPRILRKVVPLLSNLPYHHGLQHAKDVRKLAAELARTDGIISQEAYSLMGIISINHDIYDHKTDPLGENKCHFNRILAETTSSILHKFIIDCIDRVSMSREMKHGSGDWHILMPGGVLIRNYVSDADKLLSLGTEGYDRILDYNTEKLSLRQRSLLSPQQARVLVNEVDHVVQFRMLEVPNYIRTPAAKKIATAKLDELLRVHSEWRENILSHTVRDDHPPP
mgnify:CR=1 FL=1